MRGMAKSEDTLKESGKASGTASGASILVQAEKSRALEILLDAWDQALDEGIDPENIASSAVFAAFTDLIENHGEEFVAQMVEGLPGRIRAGDFSLTDGPVK